MLYYYVQVNLNTTLAMFQPSLCWQSEDDEHEEINAGYVEDILAAKRKWLKDHSNTIFERFGTPRNQQAINI